MLALIESQSPLSRLPTLRAPLPWIRQALPRARPGCPGGCPPDGSPPSPERVKGAPVSVSCSREGEGGLLPWGPASLLGHLVGHSCSGPRRSPVALGPPAHWRQGSQSWKPRDAGSQALARGGAGWPAPSWLLLPPGLLGWFGLPRLAGGVEGGATFFVEGGPAQTGFSVCPGLVGE